MNKQNVTLYVGAAIAGLIIGLALVAVFLNLDGWRTFALDWIPSLLIQMVIAGIIFAILFGALLLIHRLHPYTWSRCILWAMWVMGLLLALPILAWRENRPIDYIDIMQTILLLVIGYFLALRLSRWLIKGRTAPQSPPVSLSNLDVDEQRLFNNLMVKVSGDRDVVVRLLDYERQLQPGLNRKQCFKNAIRHWELDNQR